jgi:RNA polymerase sigma factor (sigma-70 family)
MSTTQRDPILRYLRGLVAHQECRERSDKQLLDDFATGHREAAFATLVSRHGPMVLRLCRRVLGHEQDAEDSFQATFLVLAHNYKSIRKREALAEWLHGVAYRTAMKVKRTAARQRRREAHSPAARAKGRRGTFARASDECLVAGPSWNEVQAALDEELRRLSERLRLAFVLCVLEGKTEPQAAALLGCKTGTISSRLARARQQLRRRLRRRGIDLGVLLAAFAITEGASRAVAGALMHSTVKYVLLAMGGAPAASQIPAHLSALAQGVSAAMRSGHIMLVSAVFLAVGLLAAGAGVVAERVVATAEPLVANTQSAKKSPERASAPVKVQATISANNVRVSGRVIDPTGKPVGEAKVFFARSFFPSSDPPPPVVMSDAEGRFNLAISRTGYVNEYDKDRWLTGAVVAVAPGHAPGWVKADHVEKLKDPTIALKNDVPIQGRLIDLQGLAIAGVEVQVRTIGIRADGGDLKAFVESLEKQTDVSRRRYPGTWLHPALVGLTRPVVTAADGKFRVSGIAGESLVVLRFSGPTIETAEVYAMTRPGRRIAIKPQPIAPDSNLLYHGNVFEYAAAPTRPVEGIVRDRDTGKPLPGVAVRSQTSLIRHDTGLEEGGIPLSATTDTQGHYRIVGLSRQREQSLTAIPATDEPYLLAARTVEPTSGLGPVTLDFALKRGVWIRGRITHKETGQPVRGVVDYFVFKDNPFLQEAPGYVGNNYVEGGPIAPDGTFTVLAFPGRGLLAAKAATSHEADFVVGSGAEMIRDNRDGKAFDTKPRPCNTADYNVLVEITPGKGNVAITRDLVLDPGKTVRGSIVDPEGKPLKGASIHGVYGIRFQANELPTAQFQIPGMDPRSSRLFLFQHRERNLGAAVYFKGDEPAPVTVQLQKFATITGRLVDEDGPRAGCIMGEVAEGMVPASTGIPLFSAWARKDGTFRAQLIPGVRFGLTWSGIPVFQFYPLLSDVPGLKAGEARNLGDLRAKTQP